jgi:hypothetical protein
MSFATLSKLIRFFSRSSRSSHDASIVNSGDYSDIKSEWNDQEPLLDLLSQPPSLDDMQSLKGTYKGHQKVDKSTSTLNGSIKKSYRRRSSRGHVMQQNAATDKARIQAEERARRAARRSSQALKPQ